MVICLERRADLHMAQLMPLPLTVSCFSKIQIGFTFLVLGHPGSPGKRAVIRVCVCVATCSECGGIFSEYFVAADSCEGIFSIWQTGAVKNMWHLFLHHSVHERCKQDAV